MPAPDQPMIPTLQTERLILRAPREADFEPFATFMASERARFVGGPVARDQAWRRLAVELGHWPLRGYGRWSLEERETGAYCGMVGPWFPENWPEPEIGWDLVEGFEGRGYATEAALAARDYAYGTLGWRTAISLVAPDNRASTRVAERVGATHESDFTHPVLGYLHVWRHPSPEAVA